jgi:myosin heavy subunit
MSQEDTRALVIKSLKFMKKNFEDIVHISTNIDDFNDFDGRQIMKTNLESIIRKSRKILETILNKNDFSQLQTLFLTPKKEPVNNELQQKHEMVKHRCKKAEEKLKEMLHNFRDLEARNKSLEQEVVHWKGEAENLSQENQEQKELIVAYQKKNSDLQNQMTKMEDEISSKNSKVKSLNLQLKNLTEKIHTLTQNNIALTLNNAKHKTQISDLKHELVNTTQMVIASKENKRSINHSLKERKSHKNSQQNELQGKHSNYKDQQILFEEAVEIPTSYIPTASLPPLDPSLAELLTSLPKMDYPTPKETLPTLGPFKNKYGGNYKGQWKNGKKHGRGVWVNDSGKKVYEGEWANGESHGYGRLVKFDGTVKEGFWNMGVFMGEESEILPPCGKENRDQRYEAIMR